MLPGRIVHRTKSMARSENTSTSPPSMPTPLTDSTPTMAAAGGGDRTSAGAPAGRSAIALRIAWRSSAAPSPPHEHDLVAGQALRRPAWDSRGRSLDAPRSRSLLSTG
jgi:hypothetical protein